MLTFLEILGAIVSVYFAFRVVTTAVAVLERWRAKKETPTISQLSFWSEFEEVAKTCKDNGAFPIDRAATVNVSDEDVETLGGMKNPVKAIERQLKLLFVRHGVADMVKVVREKNRLYICSTSRE
jgi:hypothetical protein